MTGRRAALVSAGLATLLALAAYTAQNFRVSTAITDLLPTAGDRQLAAVSKEMADSKQTRTLVLALWAPELPDAIAAAAAWAAELEAHPEVAGVRRGPDAGQAEAVRALYFPRRYLFLSERPEREIPELFSSAGLAAAARRLREQLALPLAPLVEAVAPADPLLAFPALLARLDSLRDGSLQLVGDQFVAGEPPRAVLFVTTRHSAFDSAHQEPFLAALAASFARLTKAYGGTLELEQSGIHRFAVASERAAERDATRISLVSSLAVVLALLVLHRSLRVAAVMLLPLASGLLGATALGLLVFGELHVLTIAFGGTLIGVCIDYPIHYLNHHALAKPGREAFASLRDIAVPLLLAGGTTVAGFAGLAAADFPGIREIGVFAIAGILVAMATTATLVPALLPPRVAATRVQRELARVLLEGLRALQRRRALPLGIACAALAICVAGLPRLRWQDDIFALNVPLEPRWQAEEERVRALVSQTESGRFVVALGAGEEDALRLNDAVHERLAAARAAGALADFRSLHALVWSQELQQRNQAALAAQPGAAERTLEALAREGFRPEAFAPFVETLSGPPPAPLRLAELLASPLGSLASLHQVPLDGKLALLTFLRGVRDPEALTLALADLPGARYFDQQRFVGSLYGRYRERTVKLIAAGVVAVVAVLYLRYRRARLALATALPPLLAAAFTLSLLALAGTPINLLHLLGLLLVLSMGVDYSVFLVESRDDSAATAASLVSVAVDCATTVLGFGLLAGSAFPALQALGTATAIGVTTSLVLAPVARALWLPAEGAQP